MLTIDSGPLGLTPIAESSGAAFRPGDLFPDFSDEVFTRAPLVGGPDYYHQEKAKLISSIHSWLFRLDGKTVLVDTCMGRAKDKGPGEAPFFRSLQAAGFSPDDIDVVVLTHLHTDHMKNNTLWDGESWKPTFANATYIAGRREYEHWQPGGAGLALHPGQVPILAECVSPLVKAGCLHLVEDEGEILPGLRSFPVPGHTATQLALVLEQAGQRFVMAADAIHHPLQVYRPHWGTALCEDSPTALKTRLALLDRCADEGAVLMPSHFAGSRAGLVHRAEHGFAFEPIVIGASRIAA